MVVDCPSAKPLPLRRDWYPDALWVHGLPSALDFREFLSGGITHVYSAETTYGAAYWDEAERAGVKTVLAVNPEFLDRHDRPTVWAAPSMWRYDQLPEPKCFLPVPITPVSGCERHSCTHFLHIVGRPATRDRNGSEDLLKALQFVTSQIRLTITCQEPGHVEGLVRRYHVPPNVELVVRSGDVLCNTDLYAGMDVLLMPRRFGGLCLPVNEALGAGLPVVMPDISPNNTWLPGDWLIPATYAESFSVKQNLVEVYSVEHRELAHKIDALASDLGFYLKAKQEAAELRDQYSWERWKPKYLEVLNGL